MDAILAALDALAEQRRATTAPAPAPRPVSPGTPPGSPIATPARPAQSAPPPAPPSHIEPPHQGNRVPGLQGMFADGNSLLRAIIAAEVLGPPASLKEQNFWNRQPNEPST